jgi:spermidine synthase
MKRLLLAALLLTAASAEAQVIYTKRSVYRNIMVTDEGDRICMSFRLKSGSINATQSCMFKTDHDLLVFDYTKMVMAGLMLAPTPKRIYVAGLGGGSIPRVFNQLVPGAQIDVAEIDESVVEVARDYFDYAEGGKRKNIIKDARVYIKQAARFGLKYDLIVLDAFNGDYIPEHLMTREFLEEAKALLSPNGILVANTFSTSRLYDSESVTYRAALGPYLNLKEVDGNRIIIARNGKPVTVAELKAAAPRWKQKLARYGVDTDWVIGVAKEQGDWDTSARVLTDQYNPANLLQGPKR